MIYSIVRNSQAYTSASRVLDGHLVICVNVTQSNEHEVVIQVWAVLNRNIRKLLGSFQNSSVRLATMVGKTSKSSSMGRVFETPNNKLCTGDGV